MEGHEHGEAAEVRALTHGERLVGFLRLSLAADSGPAPLLGPVRTDELNPLRLFLHLFARKRVLELMSWRCGTGRQGALYLQVSEGDADGAAQVPSGRVGHHHRHDSGDELDVRRHTVELVVAQLVQGLVGGGREVGVAQQGSVGEACMVETGRGVMERGREEVRRRRRRRKKRRRRRNRRKRGRRQSRRRHRKRSKGRRKGRRSLPG